MKRMIMGSNRWVAPGAAALGVLLAAWVGEAVATAGIYAWARRSPDPAVVLADAGRVVNAPIGLDSAMDVNWTFAMAHAEAGGTPGAPDLQHPLPPPVCVRGGAGDLNAAIHDLERALSRGGLSAIERALAGLSELEVGESEGEIRIRAYGLARGYLAAGDPVTAARLLDPGAALAVDGEGVPVVGPERAQALVSEGVVGTTRAVIAVYARYVAGVAALKRGRYQDAIPHLRFAVNAVAYLVPSADRSTADIPRVRRLIVADSALACDGEARSGPLDSMDLYAALVAAYLGADGFTDPTRITAELERSGLEVDPGDPLGPVLSGALEGRATIDENLLWAASNLQRVEHHNRIRPDARLSLVRGLLLLRLTEDEAGAEAVSLMSCQVLAGVDARDGLPGDGQGVPTAVDSALAGVTLMALARSAARCGTGERPDPDDRSRLLQLGGYGVAGGLPGRLEASRVALERALTRQDGSADFARILAEPEADLAQLRGGRIPPDLLRGLPVDEAATAIRGWNRAVFTDVSDALLPLLAGPDGTRRPAGESGRILTALEGAMARAGRQPNRYYDAGQVVWAARSGGAGLLVPHLARFAVRSYPTVSAVLMAWLFLVGATLALWVHVSWWRYALFANRRFYVAETLDRWNREMGSGGRTGQGGGA